MILVDPRYPKSPGHTFPWYNRSNNIIIYKQRSVAAARRDLVTGPSAFLDLYEDYVPTPQKKLNLNTTTEENLIIEKIEIELHEKPEIEWDTNMPPEEEGKVE